MTHKHAEHTQQQANVDLDRPEHVSVPVKDITDQSTLPSPVQDHAASERGEEERQEKQKVEDSLR